jgi:hypothetical protein
LHGVVPPVSAEPLPPGRVRPLELDCAAVNGQFGDLAREQGGRRASARAWFACEPPVPPQLTEFIVALPPATRPPASESTLAPGVWLGITPSRVTTEYAAQYLYDVRETELLYARESLAHPGIVLRTCNWVLAQNVILGPWIHAGSKVHNLTAAHVRDELSVRARITANYERRYRPHVVGPLQA